MDSREIKRVVIHCSASTWGCAEVIDEWHKERGWRGIGYHYVIGNGYPRGTRNFDPAQDGKLEAGRPVEEQGAHVYGHNEDSIGVCLIGSGDGRYTPNQIKELTSLVHWLMGEYNIPRGQVFGHRDLDSRKECPGFNVQEWI